jgi:hypothetical protein
LEVPEYTLGEFSEIAVTRLRKEHVDKPIVLSIAEKVWHELDSKDRDVIKVARRASSREEGSFVVKMLKKRISKSQYCACGNQK